MHSKSKGSLAELAVASILIEEGWHVLFPFGENSRYDLVIEKGGQFLRVQVKYVTPKNGSLIVNCRSSNNWSVKSYTADEIDFIAAYDSHEKRAYFIPVSEINGNVVTLRLSPTRNNQSINVRSAEYYSHLRVPGLSLDKISDFR